MNITARQLMNAQPSLEKINQQEFGDEVSLETGMSLARNAKNIKEALDVSSKQQRDIFNKFSEETPVRDPVTGQPTGDTQMVVPAHKNFDYNDALDKKINEVVSIELWHWPLNEVPKKLQKKLNANDLANLDWFFQILDYGESEDKGKKAA